MTGSAARNAVRRAHRERACAGENQRHGVCSLVVAVKTLSKGASVVACVLAVIAGCGGSPLKIGGDDGGSGSAGQGASAGQGGTGRGGGGGSAPVCAGLDEATCAATPGCQPQSCQVCSGAPTYAGCTTPGAPVACPGEACITTGPCGTLDEASCKTRIDCSVLSCPDCMGGQNFAGGTAPDGVGAGCGPCPPACNGLDEIKCAATPGCTAAHCPACMGGQGFAGCLSPNEPLPECPLACLGATCDTLDETSCKTRSDCTPQYCPDCEGGTAFAGCTGPGEGVACGCGAPSPWSPACATLGETECNARSDCQSAVCGDCSGVEKFVSCVGQNAAGVPCPALTCPKPCVAVATSAECDARTDCHSVFAEQPNCACGVAGCCASFSRCGDGGKAMCKGAPACQIVSPFCDGVAYVTSYTGSCYEGCVRPTECGP